MSNPNKSFNVIKNKIRTNFEDSRGQKNDITDEKSVNTDIENEILKTKPNLWVNSRTRNFTTDWSNPDIVLTNENGINAITKTWEVDVGIIPEDWIPYIRTDFQVRDGASGFGGTGGNFEFGSGLVAFNKNYQVIDLEPATSFLNLPEFSTFDTAEDPNSGFVQVRVLASIVVTDMQSNLLPYQMRLSVYLSHPNDYV